MFQPKTKVHIIEDLADELDDTAAYVVELELALKKLLDDVEASIDYGMPFSNPEHGFHESVMGARKILNLTLTD